MAVLQGGGPRISQKPGDQGLTCRGRCCISEDVTVKGGKARIGSKKRGRKNDFPRSWMLGKASRGCFRTGLTPLEDIWENKRSRNCGERGKRRRQRGEKTKWKEIFDCDGKSVEIR